jgi:hypothetical protein
VLPDIALQVHELEDEGMVARLSTSELGEWLIITAWDLS